MFDTKDRTPPLLVPCHVSCRTRESPRGSDARLLFRILNREGRQVATSEHEASGSATDRLSLGVAWSDSMARNELLRWVRGFHAALYHVFLNPIGVRWTVFCPNQFDSDQTGPDTIGSTPAQMRAFIELLDKNRAAKRIDQIVCYNECCTYECVWARADTSQWVCVWSLDMAGVVHQEAGDAHREGAQVVGSYGLLEMPPPIAMKETPFGVSLSGRELFRVFHT
ncbi:MAG: hypothetical protein ACKV0T_02920 [Planctomycetales bacterium]